MADIFFLAFGVYVLFRGKVPITRNIVIKGSRAKLLGWLYVLPITSVVVVGFGYGIAGAEPSYMTGVVIATSLLIFALAVTLYFAVEERRVFARDRDTVEVGRQSQ